MERKYSRHGLDEQAIRNSDRITLMEETKRKINGYAWLER
jgi:hypothetical protein